MFQQVNWEIKTEMVKFLCKNGHKGQICNGTIYIKNRPFSNIPQILFYCISVISIVTKPRFQPFMLGDIVLDRWNSDKLDYNAANKLQVLK